MDYSGIMIAVTIGLLIIIACIILIAYVWIKKRPSPAVVVTETKKPSAKLSSFLPIKAETQYSETLQDQHSPKLAVNPTYKSQTAYIQKDHQKRKGDDFEKFVLNLFPKKDYTLLNWTEDKWSYEKENGPIEEHELYPDLLLEANSTNQEYFIEAKYRSSFKDGVVSIATENQLRRYGHWSNMRWAVCFIAVGIGRSPRKPERLALIPLNKAMPTIPISLFEQYERSPQKKIYYYELEQIV